MKKFITSILCVLLFLNTGSKAFSSNEKYRLDIPDELVDMVPVNPQKALAELKKYDNKHAKFYIYYIYLTDKVRVDDKEKLIDDFYDYLTLTFPKRNFISHRDGMDTVSPLESLFSVLDINQSQKPVPVWLVKENQDTIIRYLSPRYGGHADCFIPGIYVKKDIFELPELKALLLIARQIEGRGSRQGSIWSSYGKMQNLYEEMASSVPELLLKSDGYMDIHYKWADNNLEYLRYWSNQGLYEKKIFNEFLPVYFRAKDALENYYINEFGLTLEEADIASRRAIPLSLKTSIGQFCGGFEPYINGIFYKTLTDGEITLQELKSALNGYEFVETKRWCEKRWCENNCYNQYDLNQALKFAILNHQPIEIIDYLISLGAQNDFNGDSAVMVSIQRPDVLKHLISKGFDINESNSWGKTALDYAVQYDEPESVKMLLGNGANVNQSLESRKNSYWPPTNGKITPLMYAARTGNLETVKLLIENGADVTAKDDSNQTALQYAGSIYVYDYLKEKLGVNIPPYPDVWVRSANELREGYKYNYNDEACKDNNESVLINFSKEGKNDQNRYYRINAIIDFFTGEKKYFENEEDYKAYTSNLIKLSDYRNDIYLDEYRILKHKSYSLTTTYVNADNKTVNYNQPFSYMEIFNIDSGETQKKYVFKKGDPIFKKTDNTLGKVRITYYPLWDETFLARIGDYVVRFDKYLNTNADLSKTNLVIFDEKEFLKIKEKTEKQGNYTDEKFIKNLYDYAIEKNVNI